MKMFSKYGRKSALWLVAIVAMVISFCTPPQYRQLRTTYGPEARRGIVQTAQEQIGTPYRYGGSAPGGFDCSGLVMYVYRKNGIDVPRTATDQYVEGRRVSKRNIRPGDLVFFRISGNGVSHVGIYAGRGKFIHAPKPGKRVGYASLTNPYWSRRFIGAASYLN
jgi:cell wall-associated NlpC family hydrolase